MTAIASSQVRQRAIEAYRSGQGTQKQIASAVGIHERTLRKWDSAYERNGHFEPSPRGHNPAKFQGELLDELDEFVSAHPDVTLEEIKEHFAGRVDCSIVTISNTLKCLRWTFKKRRYVRVSKTALM